MLQARLAQPLTKQTKEQTLLQAQPLTMLDKTLVLCADFRATGKVFWGRIGVLQQFGKLGKCPIFFTLKNHSTLIAVGSESHTNTVGDVQQGSQGHLHRELLRHTDNWCPWRCSGHCQGSVIFCSLFFATFYFKNLFKIGNFVTRLF